MNRTLNRRTALLTAVASSLLCVPAVAQKAPVIEVWKSPTCGCCKDWVAILEREGFTVKVFDTGNNAVRAKLGIPAALGSCHTARIGPYALEGHVPVADIRRLLRDKPNAAGLAVPGMPIGSPGMDGPAYGGRRDPFEVLLVAKDGSHRTFSRYPGTSP
jgi:hypothetical protein